MSLIKCKKCGGGHLTLKCGKESKPINIIQPFEPTVYLDKKKIVTVVLSNLPSDITVHELEQLMNEWGHIGRINLNNYVNKSAFIDFYFEKEADYFIKAVDRTPFDDLILRVDYMDKKIYN
jgi:hypothetical protein